jgi:glycosyltransferase involved in cell wall biosynthesis
MMNDISRTIPCSVNMLTRNSAESLARALESVRDFDEIVICDGGSSDQTLDIAREYGCKIVQQSKEFMGSDGRLIDYSGPRNQMLAASRNRWVFQLDSDEYATEELLNSVRDICTSEVGGVLYQVGARYELDGEIIVCASTYPIWHRRLFRKDLVGPFSGTLNENLGREVTPQQIGSYFVIPLPRVRVLGRKWLRYLRLNLHVYKEQSAEPRAISRHAARSKIRWFFRDFRRSLTSCQGRRIPFRYEAARLAFYLLHYLGYATIEGASRVRSCWGRR